MDSSAVAKLVLLEDESEALEDAVRGWVDDRELAEAASAAGLTVEAPA